jgi:hypothetical protein
MPGHEIAMIEVPVKRYLATRVIDTDGVVAGHSFRLTMKPGDEVELIEPVFDLVNSEWPGALMEMAPKTYMDWDD